MKILKLLAAFVFSRNPSVSTSDYALRNRIRHGLVGICILVAGFPAPSTFADEFDALNFVFGGSVSHDSNVFRRADSANPESDVISTGYVGLRIDKPYAQQRFQVDVTETAYRYNKFSQLDFDALNYRGAWLWHLSSRVSGTLSATRTENLVQFEDTPGNVNRDVRTNENFVFSLDALVFGVWHVLLGAAREEQLSEQAIQATPDFRSTSGEAGVRYVAQSGNSIAVIQRLIQGEYFYSILDPVNTVNDNYRQYEGEFQANWNLNPYSTVTGRVGWVDRTHDTLTQRDFSGPVGNLGYKWAPSDKVSFEWIAARRIRVFQDADTSYVVDNVLTFTPVWRPREKVSLRMRLDLYDSDYRGALPASTAPPRSDKTTSAQVGAEWIPVRSIALGANVQYQQRTSNNLLFEYDATIGTVSASLMF